MKATILIIQLVLAVSLQAEEAPKSIPIAWARISVIAQNVRWYISSDDQSWKRRDPQYFDNSQKEIEKHLSELVRDGSLVEAKINLKSISEMGDGMDKIMEFVEEIAQDHGYFVALELVDFGLRRSLSQSYSDVDKPQTVVVRLPEAQLKKYKDVVAQNNLLAPKDAENVNTGQPSIRPESKPEGNEKPKPEAEERSR
jgi:hypothetical protein